MILIEVEYTLLFYYSYYSNIFALRIEDRNIYHGSSRIELAMATNERGNSRAFGDRCSNPTHSENHPEELCCTYPLLRGTEDLAEFIIQNYSGRVVEVGAGCRADVALCLLKQSDLDVVITDKLDRGLCRLRVEKDDIFSPHPDLYAGASLLYSIRPPLELQLAMGALARKLGADTIIRPLADEIAELPGFTRSLINVGEARFYLFKPASLPQDGFLKLRRPMPSPGKCH